MQVLLHPDIDASLLVVDKSKYGNINPGFDLGCHINGESVQGTMKYNSIPERCQTCISMRGSYMPSGNHCHHNDSMPPKAVYVTNILLESRSIIRDGNKAIVKYNISDRLITIYVRKQATMFPQDAEYCIIQNHEFYNKYSIDNIDTYPPVNSNGRNITPYPESLIKGFLEKHNEKYSGEQNYKIIQKQVLLVRVVGCGNIKSEKFQKLLLVDSATLEKEVMRLVKDTGIILYSCEFTERPVLIDALYNSLVTTDDKKFATTTTLSYISSYIEKLHSVSSILEKALEQDEEISKLKLANQELMAENKKYKDLLALITTNINSI